MPFFADTAWERISKLAPYPAHLQSYYADILSQYKSAFDLAELARAKGLDPKTHVEPSTVFDLADRVDKMLALDQFEGLGERLRELLRTVGKDRAAVTISQEIALGKFGMIDAAKALEYGVRTGLAVITDGVTVAPIQGIYSVSIKQNDDNSNYASVSYAGPMRSAGGTEGAFSLVIADITARKLGLSNYRARQEEIGRFTEELRVYEREVGNFQYRVTDEDVRTAISNLPVEIDGVETDPVEVVVHRNLTRVGTDRVRGGALRVLNDGVIGRAHKLAKKLESLSISGWEWLTELKGGTQQSTNETEQAGAHFEEVISGRAVLSSPKRRGGFRLRYGRSMNTGLSTIGIHPAVAILLDYPVVAGTQVKVDLPGKAATIAFVDSIEGPTVLLADGSVRRLKSLVEAEELRGKAFKVIDLGDILISFGDFLENNKNLSPSPYVAEWWAQELEQSLLGSGTTREGWPVSQEKLENLVKNPTTTSLSASEAIAISRATNIPLHPAHTYRFDRLTVAELTDLRNHVTYDGTNAQVDVTSHHTKEQLERLLLPHRIDQSSALVEGEEALILVTLLRVGQRVDIPQNMMGPLDFIANLSGIRLGRQTTATVGVRVGRPEKAMVRKLKPPVHMLFPVGQAGGNTRDAVVAARVGRPLQLEVANIMCESCGARRFSARCEECGSETTRFLSCPRCNLTTQYPACPNCKIKTQTYSPFEFDLKSKLASASLRIPHNTSVPVKGVRGLTSQSKTPEPIEKGILRSKHEVYVYKDGTTRIDVTNAPLTHFRPSDIRTDVQTLVKLGYDKDHRGNPLTEERQTLELKPQDVVVPIDIADDLVRMTQFLDDELENFYGLPAFYGANGPSDLVGKIVLGLAPHTSVGVAARILGFASTEVCFANPCWHAAKRRDCDGDGDSLLLLLDALLNFSTEYIPNQIGGLMDTPLLIQPVVIPSEVDEQAHNFDIASRYPKEFYERTEGNPTAASLGGLVERIGSRLQKENQFYSYGFTHDTSAIGIKRARGAYSTLRTLVEKIDRQIEVAERIDAVSTKEVVESIIKTHLIRDIMGNMKKYASQSFKCRACGYTFRRPPVSGLCTNCGRELHGTLTRASVEKYVAIAQRLAREYDVDQYLKNRLEMAEKELDQLFRGREKSTQMELTDFVERPSGRNKPRTA